MTTKYKIGPLCNEVAKSRKKVRYMEYSKTKKDKLQEKFLDAFIHFLKSYIFSLMLKHLRFDIFELQETKLPVRLIKIINERILAQGREIPLRVKGDIEAVSSELDNGEPLVARSNNQNGNQLGMETVMTWGVGFRKKKKEISFKKIADRGVMALYNAKSTAVVQIPFFGFKEALV
ncbi:UNVERIFIED_CONTAM: hypothetical protein NCL1_22940 [Trichonephila clavipes]